MFMLAMLSSSVLAADPTEERTIGLLKTFRGEFVRITPGQGEFPRGFAMGSRQPEPSRPDGSPAATPEHDVAFDHSFEIAKYEVTQELWLALMGNNPSRWKGDRNSVEMLTFDDAREFCRRATARMRAAGLIRPDQRVRLPSEAEWEYACRAGTNTAYSFGDDRTELGRYAWYAGNAKGNDPPVGAKAANPWGLYDVHGYLWEWCEDVARPDYTATPRDGSPATVDEPSDLRILRGGSWKDAADRLTSSFRRAEKESYRHDAVGLRCVLDRDRARPESEAGDSP